MSFARDILDAAREGAADLLGLGDELADLREARDDLRMLARGVQGLRDTGLHPGLSEHEPDRYQHRQTVNDAYDWYFGGGNVRRGVDLQTLYVFAAGVAVPRYRERPDEDGDAEHVDRATKRIAATWNDPRNQAVITGVQGQHEKSLELQVQSSVFFVVLDGDGDGDDDPLAHFRDLPEEEVVDIITHPADSRMPLFYVRQYQPSRWVPTGGIYGQGQREAVGSPVTTYYRHLTFDAPEAGEIDIGGGVMVGWQPPDKSQIAEGRVLHLTVNKHSRMRFGVSELATVLPAARRLHKFVGARSNTTQALAQLAMKVSTQGGSRSVAQAASKLQDVQRLANNVVDGAVERTRADDETAKAVVTSKGVDVKPMVTDTGAASAKGEIDIHRGEIAAGFGINRLHFGAEAGGLAGSIVADRPLTALLTARQTLWRNAITALMAPGLEAAGFDPARLEVKMPALTDRDAGTTAEVLVSVLEAVFGLLKDPSPEARGVARFLLQEVLDAMGKEHVAELVDSLVPEEPIADVDQDGVPDDKEDAGRNGTASLRDELADARSRARAGGLRQADELDEPGSEIETRRTRAERRVNRALEGVRDGLDLPDDDLAVIVEGALGRFDEILTGG